MIQAINSSPSFKSVYKYPVPFTKKQKKASTYLKENILYSNKYADKNGDNLAEAFDKLGFDIVIYPSGKDKIVHRVIPKQLAFTPIEEVNKSYPNVKRVPIKSEEEMVDIFNFQLDTMTRMTKSCQSDRKNLYLTIGGIILAFLALLFGAKACSSKAQEEAIKRTLITNNESQPVIKHALNIFKQ